VNTRHNLYALPRARFPGSYSFKVYNEEQVRPFLTKLDRRSDLAYFVVQLFTSGCVPRWLVRYLKVATNSRIVGRPFPTPEK
jgi:hypothetical protein